MKHTLTPEQAAIVKDYIETHGLRADQISFDGDNPTPIFDHNATSTLSLKLTDIQDISPTAIEDNGTRATVFSRATLPDGRGRGGFGTCDIGEMLGNGQTVNNMQVALGVANSRSYSQSVRNVGVNLNEAHIRFKQTGEIAASHMQEHPRKAGNAEIKFLARELDLIVDDDEKKYREYLADNYEGRTSTSDLTDIEFQRLLINFRSMARLRREKQAA